MAVKVSKKLDEGDHYEGTIDIQNGQLSIMVAVMHQACA